MICDMDSVYRPRNKKVRFYETESGSEWDFRGFLIGLNNEDLSDGLRDKIMELSPYLFEVFSAIQKGIKYQENAKNFAKMEEESFIKRGFKKKSPGIWQLKGGDGKMYDVKELSDYPVDLEEQKKRK